MKFTSKYNSFEKEIMAPVNQIKYVTIVLIIINLIVPIYKPSSMGITSLFQWLIVITDVLMIIGCYGYIPRFSPIIMFSLVRFIQGFIHIRAGDMYLFLFIGLCVLDTIIVVLIMIDRSRYDIVCIGEGEDD